MPMIKLGEVSIPSERLGFPATIVPTPDQAAQKVLEALDDRDKMENERNNWREKAEGLQSTVKTLRANEDKLKDYEGDLLLRDAVSAFKLDAIEIPFLKEMYKTNPKAVRDHLDKLRAKTYLREEQGMSGDAAAPDALAEFTVKVLEKTSHDPKLSEASAALKVYAETPGLQERVMAERREVASRAEGGKG
jgi:hypothetical protein